MSNPSPYDDLGWTYPMMRNLIMTPVTDKSLLTARDVAGDRTGARAGRRHRHGLRRSSSSTPATTCSRSSGSSSRRVKMSAAEVEFEAGGRKFGAGRVHHSERQSRAARAGADGASDCPATPSRRCPPISSSTISTCRASATSTAGATRRTKAGCARRSTTTRFRTPTSARTKSRRRDLRAQFDVILWPHGGGIGQEPPTTGTPVPFKKTRGVPGARLSGSRPRTREAGSASRV